MDQRCALWRQRREGRQPRRDGAGGEWRDTPEVRRPLARPTRESRDSGGADQYDHARPVRRPGPTPRNGADDRRYAAGRFSAAGRWTARGFGAAAACARATYLGSDVGYGP